jgi:hypothetical protein
LVQHTKTGKNIPTSHKIYPNGHKIDQTAIFLGKIYPKWDFWFENMPSGNPGVNSAKRLN